MRPSLSLSQEPGDTVLIVLLSEVHDCSSCAVKFFELNGRCLTYHSPTLCARIKLCTVEIDHPWEELPACESGHGTVGLSAAITVGYGTMQPADVDLLS